MDQATFNTHALRIKLEGYTIVPGLLTSEECRIAREELEERYPDRARGGLEWLFNKAQIFERLYKLPDLLCLIRHFIGPDALLSAIYGSVIMPGEGGRGLHADGGVTGHNRTASIAPADVGRRITSHPMAINVIFCLSEFTANNGATELVPGSHRYPFFDIPEEAYENARTAVAPEGSAVVLDINTWHGATRNHTDQPRYAVLSPWRRRWTKCEYEMARVVKADVLERAGEEGPVIFGLQAQPPYTELWQWDRETGGPKPEFAHLRRN
ncbi:MAG: phytanoyl-CoA dioxygenase family protein [candidate division Zixibacteria bacterium]|nr:phytanoyl-CoA dioxygenase family protein [candidate division Zixibacteria bacterium]